MASIQPGGPGNERAVSSGIASKRAPHDLLRALPAQSGRPYYTATMQLARVSSCQRPVSGLRLGAKPARGLSIRPRVAAPIDPVAAATIPQTDERGFVLKEVCGHDGRAGGMHCAPGRRELGYQLKERLMAGVRRRRAPHGPRPPAPPSPATGRGARRRSRPPNPPPTARARARPPSAGDLPLAGRRARPERRAAVLPV
jgi:hypothetical protein